MKPRIAAEADHPAAAHPDYSYSDVAGKALFANFQFFKINYLRISETENWVAGTIAPGAHLLHPNQNRADPYK
ncbi:MAG: hypothetical protein ABFD97_01285 [Syntrophobacter sp.]